MKVNNSLMIESGHWWHHNGRVQWSFYTVLGIYMYVYIFVFFYSWQSSWALFPLSSIWPSHHPVILSHESLHQTTLVDQPLSKSVALSFSQTLSIFSSPSWRGQLGPRQADTALHTTHTWEIPAWHKNRCKRRGKCTFCLFQSSTEDLVVKKDLFLLVLKL